MKILTKILFSFLILFGVFFAWLNFIFHSTNNEPCQEEVFSVSRGENFREIARNLEEKEIISNHLYFELYVLLSRRYGNLQAGTYLLNSCESVSEIVGKISRGETAQKKITIVEGWNIEQIANYLNDLEFVNEEIFLDITKSGGYFENDFEFLKDKPLELGLEGYLFPDTYLIPFNSSEKEIVEIILSNFESRTASLLQEIKNQEKSIFETIIKASLIEKEVREYEDKELVSGIIEKRMEIGMPLQIDATIAYITGRRTTQISIAETQIDSPYNTYRYRGLPVGPISNPGIKSIQAAVFPKKSDYLFYLSKPDGETVFSRNLEEHNAAKNRYLR